MGTKQKNVAEASTAFMRSGKLRGRRLAIVPQTGKRVLVQDFGHWSRCGKVFDSRKVRAMPYTTLVNRHLTVISQCIIPL